MLAFQISVTTSLSDQIRERSLSHTRKELCRIMVSQSSWPLDLLNSLRLLWENVSRLQHEFLWHDWNVLCVDGEWSVWPLICDYQTLTVHSWVGLQRQRLHCGKNEYFLQQLYNNTILSCFCLKQQLGWQIYSYKLQPHRWSKQL